MNNIATILFIFSFLAGVHIVQCQENLISNPSFEEYYTCDFDITNSIIQDIIPGWYFKTNTSPRYLSTICLGGSSQVTQPIFGDAYVASAVDAQAIEDSGWADRQYLQTRLIKPLEANRDYYISYWVTLPWNNDTPLSHYGVHFTNEWWEGPRSFDGNAYPILLDPQVEVDTLPNMAFGKWTKIEQCFTLDSTVSVMVAGIFAHHAEMLGIEDQFGNYTFNGYDNFLLAEIPTDVELEIPADTICVGDCFPLRCNHSGFEPTIEWNLPGSNLLSSQDWQVEVCYQEAGVYDIEVELNHCGGTFGRLFEQAITVLPAIVEEPIADQSICKGDSLFISISTDYSVIWDDGTLGNERWIVDQGEFVYMISDGYCEMADTFSIQFTLDPQFSPIELYSCAEDSVVLDDIIYFTPGLYIDTLVGSSGCDSVYREIDYRYFEESIALDNSYSICPDENIVISLVDGAHAILWSDGSTEQNFTITQAGDYTVSYLSENDCNQSHSFAVQEYLSPEVEVDDIDYLFGSQSIQVTPIYSQDVMHYSWYPEHLFDCANCPYPNIINPTQHDITLKVINADGCEEIVTFFLMEIYPNIFIPNIISITNIENGTFVIGSDFDFEYSISIFDRWGNVVFQQEDAKTNNTNHLWTPDKTLQIGVYVYMITLPNGEVLSGDVTVVR